MPLGWEVDDELGQDMYRQMWEDYDDQWDFRTLNDEDWANWGDDPNFRAPGVNDALHDNLPPSSSTLDSSSPPRPSQDERLGRHNPTPTTRGSQRNHLLRRMRNTHSQSTSDSRSSGPAYSQSNTQFLRSNQRRTPAASHSEDWLDRTEANRTDQNSFTFDLFEPVNEDSSSTSDGVDIDDFLSDCTPEEDANNMPTRRTRRRADDSIVDLTNDSSPPHTNTESTRQPVSLKRAAEATSQKVSKRSRHTDNTETKIEELDLTNEAPSAEEELLQAQQRQAIAAQQAIDGSHGPLKIGKRQCIICMEPFTNATITHCGHIYCHECLTQALVAGEKNSERGVGNCPVCRKPVNRKKQNQTIVLSFMKKGAFKGKGKRSVV